MRLFRRNRAPRAAEIRKEPGRESARALAGSQESLRREREQVVVPLRHLIEQNNVTELVRELIRKKGEADGHGAAAG